MLLEEIASFARSLQKQQRGLEIGQLISLIRKQLMMSQRALAEKSAVPQSTISKIESGDLRPNVSTLDKISNALNYDLLITVVPRAGFEEIRRRQAVAKAKERVEYLQGTMSLEKQKVDKKFLEEMIEEETQRLLHSRGFDLWAKG
ncbi:helix-turn-helix domain-containing protein [Simkania negevensis]|uniref:Helix-turn-helix domain-containing protein n=1 Tax=Simkania negevensis TaxID=83561 RepID=A0ABS3ARG8_9BACT|nr:helix-turn-helix domain-containing protein [Simkania negevensis]